MFGLGKHRSADRIENNPSPITELVHEPVTYLEQYLSYYVSRLEPGYAVLVTGGWGSGKTYQVTRALPKSHAYYVSLFGLATPEAIEAQIFSAMYPWKAAIKKTSEKADGVNLELPIVGGLGMGGLASAMASIFIKNEVDASKPLILDDLERSTVDIKILLGLINHYVEHHKCRVIVIAHDAKIVSEFTETKEKVFGQTIVVQPDIEAAFQGFIDEFKGKSDSNQRREIKREILTIFRESTADSLRVLRHVVEDVERLLSALDAVHLDNHAAMVELVRLFSSLAIEVRLGRLDRGSILHRQNVIQAHKYGIAGTKQDSQPEIVSAAARYVSVDLGSSIMQDRVLEETIFDGRFIANNIQESVNSSIFFTKKAEMSPWRIVGSFDVLSDDVVDVALQSMKRQFEQREILESGDFLHIVALNMMMAFKGLSGETVDNVRDAALQYIDDLLGCGRLPERPAAAGWHDSLKDSYAGVMYWVHDEYRSEFSEVFRYLIGAREKALEKRFVDLVPPLLEVVRADGQKFFEMVCYTRDGNIEYEDVPILAHVPVKDFVSAWLASPRAGWRSIGRALSERRKAIPHHSSLQPENEWYREVQDELLTRARAENGLAQLRIVRAAGAIG
jgi:hypothetical protein